MPSSARPVAIASASAINRLVLPLPDGANVADPNLRIRWLP